MTIETGLYEHYSGKRYQVLGVCRHTETLKILVIYQALYDNYALWVRPLDMFKENVIHNGRTVQRFRFISKIGSEPVLVNN